MEITAGIAEFIAASGFEEIPLSAIDIAKNAFLDTVGVALAGSRETTSKIISDFVRDIGGSPAATVIRQALKSSAPNAALANGTAAHAMDYDDNAMPMRAHASAVLVPSVFALAEEESVSGKDILAAYVIGREVGGKVGDAMGGQHWSEGWHSTSTVGVIAAAAAASKILKLNAQTTARALSIAASQASGLKAQFGTMSKPFQAGMAARNGVTAAMLAHLGFSANENIFEDDFGYFKVLGKRNKADYARIPRDLGNPWDILEHGVIVKPNPGVAFTSIEALLRLIKSHSILPDRVKSIEARISSRFLAGHRSDLLSQPETAMEGRFSIEFNIAIALLEGQAGLAQFTDEKVQSPLSRETMKKIRVIGCDATPSDPEKMIVTLQDGSQYTEKYTPARGSLANPIDDDGLNAKFRDCARYSGMPEEAIEHTIRLIHNLEQLPDSRELMQILA